MCGHTTMELIGAPIDSCQEACCAGEQNSTAAQYFQETDYCQEACCGEEMKATERQYLRENASCQDKCCAEERSSAAVKPRDSTSCQGACCDSSSSTKDGNVCRTQEQLLQQASKDPPCCAGKPSPCCDKSCLERLAARECQNGTDCSEISTCNLASEIEGHPCEKHTVSTREKYAAKLQALGCLCRALLALGQESCCIKPEKSSLERKRSSRCGSQQSINVKSQSRAISPRARSQSCTEGCCSPISKKEACNSTADCCISPPGVTSITTTNNRVSRPKEKPRDLETGHTGKEHVILGISGMTCTGCETKLQRSLAGLESVKNLKTSLILSRAEFDVDLSTSNTDEVIKHLTRTTEFKCEKVSNSTGFSFEVMTDGKGQELIDRPWPLGVLEMILVDNSIVSIAYDSKIIGARDLIEKGWSSPLQLAPPRADPTLDAGSKHVRHIGFTTFLAAVLTVPVLVMAWAPLPPREVAYGSASLVLATLIQFLIAGPFYITAVKSLVFSKVIEMDLLVVLSTSTAYIYSVISFGYLMGGHPLSTGEFFETSTLLVTLIVLGRYVAAHARQKAVESISMRSLQASTATLVEETGEREIDIRLLQYGDMFKTLPDSRVATDGTVILGSSEVDESMVTGESNPVEKHRGSSVIAGSINGAGTLQARVDRPPGHNTISDIAKMVDQAKLSKPKLQGLADRVASYCVPAIIGLTVITFCVWVAVGRAVQNKSGSDAVIQAITFSITVLIVSCPCAIGLAVPMVIVIASGVAAERGVIIKDSSTIEVAHKTTHVIFDKTGTLTEGRLTVMREVYLTTDCSVERTQALLLKFLDSNKHPVSAALASKLKADGVMPVSEDLDTKVLVGKGIEAVISPGLILRAGHSRWLDVSSRADVQSVSSEGYTTFCFTINGSLAAVFGLQDTLRVDAASTVDELVQRGIAVHVLSGDDKSAVRKITRRLNITEENVQSRCTPADKQAYIQRLQSRPDDHSQPTVIFCGDGTNDAVALAQATIGVHMNTTTGTDVASSAADVVLMRPSLSGILTLIDISKKSVRRIRFNFAWSAVYNLFAILLGAGAFSAIGGRGAVKIPPAFAGLGELVSVLPVVAAAVLMRWDKSGALSLNRTQGNLISARRSLDTDN